MATNYERLFQKDYEKLYKEREELCVELRTLKYLKKLSDAALEAALKREDVLKAELEAKSQAAEKKIIEQAVEIERLNCLLGRDGKNSGTPTSQTPIDKAKVVPNSRVKSGKKVGGQVGHPRHKLERFGDGEFTQKVEHKPDRCPDCGSGSLDETGETIEKDELDYKVTVTKTRHMFRIYRCPCCNKEIHEPIPNRLKEDCQYGPEVQALALDLMDEGNVTINKTAKMILGLTRGEIALSEGYLAKLQRRASAAAGEFCADLKRELLAQPIVHWDDTVIMVNKRRACLRFYGTEELALYKAHEHKDKEGMMVDGILSLLPPTATVVHDHLSVNYSPEFSYQDAECNEHLLRDLRRVTDNLGHAWAGAAAKFLTGTNNERKALMAAGANGFEQDVLSAKLGEFDSLMLQALQENRHSPQCYYADKEATLILRLLDYKDQYLAWMVNFDIPFTNNLAERGLRGAKSKMKASGQFQNVDRAADYANIKSYLETCVRNGVNGFRAFVALAAGLPLKLKDVLAEGMVRARSLNQPDSPGE